jgi:glutathione S-transferase
MDVSESATDLVLYTFRRCPYAMRARLALLSSRLSYEAREVDLKNKPLHMLTLSPKGTVPVLWIQSGGQSSVVDQSLSIMRWCLSQNDPQSWLSTLEDPQSPGWALIEQNDGPFKAHLDRYKYPSRFGLDHAEQHRGQAAQMLFALQERLQYQAFLSGERWGLVDAAIAPFVRQFAHTDQDWFAAQAWPELCNWLSAFEASADFLAIMQKLPLWHERA